MAFKFLLFLVAAVGAASIHDPQSQLQQQQRQRQSTEARNQNEDGTVGYDFSYSVQDPTTGDIKSQEESRRNGNVRGQYSWVDADGNRQIVEYQADDRNGFQSEHRREPAAPRPRTHHVVQVIPAPLYTIDTILAPVHSSVSRFDHHRRQHQDDRDDRDVHDDDRDNRDNRDGRDGRDDRDNYDNRDGRDGRDGRDDRDSRDGRDGRDGRDSRDGRDNRNNARDNRDEQNRSRDRQQDERRGRESQAQSEVRFQDPAVAYQYSN